MSLRSPLGRARGLGSAKSGTEHWWLQRLSAVALVPLSLWFVTALAGHVAAADHAAVVAWMSHPGIAIALIIFISTLLYHSKLGVQVVIEDYVHGEAGKLICLVGSTFAHLALAAAGVFAVLKVAFGG